MLTKRLRQKPNKQLNRDSAITKPIRGLKIAIGRRLFFNQAGTNNLYSVVLIEGHSKIHNFIYGRVERGYPVGTPMQNVPGDGAVCLLPSDLKGFEVTCALGG